MHWGRIKYWVLGFIRDKEPWTPFYWHIHIPQTQ